MKKVIIIIMILAFSLSVVGCGQVKNIDGKTYGTYGLFNESEMKNPDVEYRLVVGNVVLGILLVETIIAPIYFFGFSPYNPVGPKGDIEKGVIENYAN